MPTEKGEGYVIVWKESPLPIKCRIHSYQMLTARLSGQAQDDPLITPYMVMGLMSRDRNQHTSRSVYGSRERERERKKGSGWEEGAERERESERKGGWWEGGMQGKEESKPSQSRGRVMLCYWKGWAGRKLSTNFKNM